MIACCKICQALKTAERKKGREGIDFNSESRKGNLSVKVETRALTLSRVGSAQKTGRSIALVSVGSSLADTRSTSTLLCEVPSD